MALYNSEKILNPLKQPQNRNISGFTTKQQIISTTKPHSPLQNDSNQHLKYMILSYNMFLQSKQTKSILKTVQC